MSETEQEKTEELEAVGPEKLPDDVPLFEGDDLVSLIEALLFACSEPLGTDRLSEITRAPLEKVEAAIATLKDKYCGDISGFDLVGIAGQYQLRTRPQFAPYIRVMRAGRPRRLSHAALETLAVIAYRQPVVKSDIEKIRGVDVTPTLKTLLDRRLVRILGHQPTVGQPALYGTTDEFMKLFGLNSLAELPTLRDLKELEGDPGEPVSQEPGGCDANSLVDESLSRGGGIGTRSVIVSEGGESPNEQDKPEFSAPE